MPDNIPHRGLQHSNTINVHVKWEVDYWTRELGVSEMELVQAVMAAGSAVKSVKHHLGCEPPDSY